MRGVEDSPVGAITHRCEALLDRIESRPTLIGQEPQNILHDEHPWFEIIHVERELFKETISRVFVIRGSEGPQRRKTLAGRTADDNVNLLSLNQVLHMRRSNKANVAL